MRVKLAETLGGIAIRIRFLSVVCVTLAMGELPSVSAPPYPLAIASFTNINLAGNHLTVDSFDSRDPNYSSWNTNFGYGIYDISKRKANGNVGTDSSIIGGISAGQGNIYGHVDIGPDGMVAIGNNGYVGPLPQTGTGIQPGYLSTDMDVTFPDVILPAGANSWQSVPGNNVISVGGNYQMSGLAGSLKIDAANVNLYVAGDILLSSQQAITVTTNVSHVNVYVAGPQVSVSGNAAINNLTLHASVLSIYGLPTLTSINLAGSAVYTGTLYAPEADFQFGGIGNYIQDFVGFVVANSVELNGYAGFHFDEALAAGMPLWISPQPSNQTVALGAQASFSTEVGGGYALSYHWFFNQTNLLPGATGPSLSLDNVQLTNAGTYSVVATNLAGAVTSAPASLVVYTNAAAALTPTAANNGFQFSVSGVSGLNYTVQASTNLTDWISLSTNQAPFNFADTNLPAFPQHFYRVVCWPP